MVQLVSANCSSLFTAPCPLSEGQFTCLAFLAPPFTGGLWSAVHRLSPFRVPFPSFPLPWGYSGLSPKSHNHLSYSSRLVPRISPSLSYFIRSLFGASSTLCHVYHILSLVYAFFLLSFQLLFLLSNLILLLLFFMSMCPLYKTNRV